MRGVLFVFVSVLRVLGYAVFAVLLCCPSAALAHRNIPVLYVSDADSSDINIFRLDNGKPVGTIPYPMAPGGRAFGSGAGVATDAQDNLYAGYLFDNGNNYPGKAVIYGFAPGQSHWFTVIEAGCCTVPSLSISKRGEIAETFDELASCCQGGIGFIEPGKKYVRRFNGYLAGAYYAAYDSTGALWADGYDENFRPTFGIIPHGNDTFEVVKLEPKSKLGPLAVDPANNVLVYNTGVLHAYDRHGKLVYSVSLTGADSSVSDIVLSRDAKTMYVAEQSGSVLAYAFPSGGMAVARYHVGGSPYDIAIGSI
jgi:hypothetical protein